MNIEIVVTILSVGYGVASGVIAFVQGRRKRKATQGLTQAEQREDLRNQMIEEIESAESTAKLFPKTANVKAWKKDTVLKNITLYAKGQGYGWYDREEWSIKIDDYVKSTKKVNFNGSSAN